MHAESWLTMKAPIGTLLLAARNQRLSGIVIFDPADETARQTGEMSSPSPAVVAPVLKQAQQELEEYFAGRRRSFDVPLDLSGQAPFTGRVLEALCAVPYGAILTYGELALRAGNPRAARAVGRAMAVNPLPIVIPCHRVVAAGGRLCGYSGGGGVRTKEWLLAFEQRNRLAS